MGLAWGAFSGGATDRGDALALFAIVGVLALWPSPRPAANLPGAAFIVALAAIALLQTLPLPAGLVAALSPHAAELQQALADVGVEPRTWIPISLDPGETLYRLAQLAAMLAAALAVAQRTADAPWRVALPLVAVSAGQAALGLAQHLQRHESLAAAGSYVNRNHFAGLMEIALPAAVALAAIFARRAAARESGLRNWLRPTAAAAAAGLIFVALLLSYSRAAFLSAAAAVAAALYFARTRSLRRSRAWPQAASRSVLAFGAVALLLALAPGELVERFEGLSHDYDSEGRAQLWQETLDLAADYPLVGCGFGAYESCFPRYKRSAAAYRDDFAHNDYLQLASELGLPALLLALAGVAALLRAGVRTALSDPSPDRAAFTIAALASIAALLVHSLFDFNLYIPANAIAFGCLCGALGGRKLPSV